MFVSRLLFDCLVSFFVSWIFVCSLVFDWLALLFVRLDARLSFRVWLVGLVIR